MRRDNYEFMIDTHTHIYDDAFDADRSEVVRRAREAGVEAMMCPAIDSASHERLFDVCRQYAGYCLPIMGLHPTSVNDSPDWRHELDIVAKLLAEPPVERFYGIGEVGLDLYWSRDRLSEQQQVFEKQVELSLLYDLPLVIHVRDAWLQMREVLEGFAGKGLRGVMHSFSGTVEDYHAIKAMGDFVFGTGGPVTYKNSTLVAVLEHIPLSEIVLETDSPYLPPVPFRGKRNESGYLTYICEKVAQIKGVTPEQVAEATTENAKRLFDLEI